MVDILDIKWDSLVQQGKQKSPMSAQSKSALRRYAAHNIFSCIGVSAAFAGEALMTRLQAVCQQQMDEEAADELAATAEGDSLGLAPAPHFMSKNQTQSTFSSSSFTCLDM